MWRETNMTGIYLPSILVYITVAFLLTWMVRTAMVRLGMFRQIWNPPLAEAAIYVCVLGVLVRML